MHSVKKTKKVHEFYSCYWHGHICVPFRVVSAVTDATLAQRYENTMARLEQITQAGYKVEIQ